MNRLVFASVLAFTLAGGAAHAGPPVRVKAKAAKPIPVTATSRIKQRMVRGSVKLRSAMGLRRAPTSMVENGRVLRVENVGKQQQLVDKSGARVGAAHGAIRIVRTQGRRVATARNGARYRVLRKGTAIGDPFVSLSAMGTTTLLKGTQMVNFEDRGTLIVSPNTGRSPSGMWLNISERRGHLVATGRWNGKSFGYTQQLLSRETGKPIGRAYRAIKVTKNGVFADSARGRFRLDPQTGAELGIAPPQG